MNISLCASCALGGSDFRDRLAAAVLAAGHQAQVALVDCLSGCARPSTLALRSPGKTAYLFGDLTAKDLPDLLTLFALYADSPDGNLADARPLGALRSKALARIPG